MAEQDHERSSEGLLARLRRMAKYLRRRPGVDVEDAIQELLQGAEGLERELNHLNDDSWLYGKLRNEVRSLYRDSLQRVADMDSVPESIPEARWASLPDGDLRDRESRERIRRHLQRVRAAASKLPRELRDPYCKRRFD